MSERAFDPIAEAHRQWTERYRAAEPMAAVTSVMRVQQLLLSRVNALLRPYGLSFARYEALMLLVFSRRGSLPLGKMGERLMVHPTSMTSTIDRLERDGFVKRTPDPQDRRRTLAEITPEGRAAAEQATTTLTGARFALGRWSDGEASDLTGALQRLRVALGDIEAGTDPAP